MSTADSILGAAKDQVRALAAPDLDARPRKKVAVLACMDARLDVFPLLGLDRGDAHIIRNAGGLVTDDAIRSLTISQRLLGTEEIIVMMHDGCGLLRASEEDFADALRASGVAPAMSLGAFDDLDEALGAGLARLRADPVLLHRDSIRGFVFDPSAGTLREVDPPPEKPESAVGT
jgi:carbonic anhydrase